MQATCTRVDGTGVFLLHGASVAQLLVDAVNGMRHRSWMGAVVRITDASGAVVFDSVVPAYLPESYGE